MYGCNEIWLVDRKLFVRWINVVTGKLIKGLKPLYNRECTNDFEFRCFSSKGDSVLVTVFQFFDCFFYFFMFYLQPKVKIIPKSALERPIVGCQRIHRSTKQFVVVTQSLSVTREMKHDNGAGLRRRCSWRFGIAMYEKKKKNGWGQECLLLN